MASMWKRKKKPRLPDGPQPDPIAKYAMPAVELIDGWGSNPMDVMPHWSDVRRQAAFALADQSTQGFILLRVHRGGLPGNRERVEVDACIMPYQRQAIRDTLESLYSQLK